MLIRSSIVLLILISRIHSASSDSAWPPVSPGISYNQPKLCPNPEWDFNGTIYMDSGTNSTYFYNIFIDINNSIYLTSRNPFNAQFGLESYLNMTTKYSILPMANGLFVKENGDIYVANITNNTIELWTWNSTKHRTISNVTEACSGLFIDTNNTLYCCLMDMHVVISLSLMDNSTSWMTVAGNYSFGSGTNQLFYPNGIFVNIDIYLYVADTYNHRIQVVKIGEPDGTTIVGDGEGNSISLQYPTGIILDADNNIFIADQSSIIMLGPNGSQCIIGCSDTSSPLSGSSVYPRSLSFDSSGNIFVVNSGDNNIQMFTLLTNLCDPKPPITTTATTQYTLSPDYSVPSACSDPSLIGKNCNISTNACEMMDPCQNQGICVYNTTNPQVYFCVCQSGFSGTRCELDNRPCKSTTCWNNGTCLTTSNSNFICSCPSGWEGIHCEQMINYCLNVTCLHNSVCRPLLHGYKCECLSGMYSGEYCEHIERYIITRKYFSTSCGIISIFILSITAAFVIILDILKFFFHIDVSKKELRKIQREKFISKHKIQIPEKPRIAIRYIYINQPSIVV